MARFEKERKITDILYSRVAIAALLLIAVLMVLSVISVLGKRAEARKQAKAAEVRLQELTERHAELSADILRLKTDEGKEEALRARYRAAKPGEELVVIVDEDVAHTSSSAQVAEDASFLEEFISFFKNLFSERN